MRSRLAQIVAGAVGTDGKIDRTKVYAALQLTPDAPEALLIDAFLATEEGVADFGKAVAAQATALKGVIDSEASQLQAVFERQKGDAEAIKDQLAILFEDLVVARAQARGKLEKDTGELRDLGERLAVSAEKVAAQTRRVPFVALAGLEIYLPESAAIRSTLLLVGGFLVGVIAAFAFVLTRTH